MDIEKEYKKCIPSYENLLSEARFTLENGLAERDIKIHAILGRIKDLESFIQKTDRLNSQDPFNEVTDIVGLRAICLLRSDIEKIGDLIRSSFLVLSEDNKIDGQEVSSFGYQSVHFLVTMNPEFVGPRYDAIKEKTFEIQVRTIAMDAWATVSHYLDYKSDHDVPKHMRKDFYALSGLFYVVDTHFELFYQAGSDNLNAAIERIKDEDSIEGEELNIDTLRAYIAKKITDHSIPESYHDGYSGLITELTASGYSQISELDSAIDRGWDAFIAYEKKHPPWGGGREDKKFSAVGVIRSLMCIVDKNYHENRINETKYDNYEEFTKMVKPE